MSLQICGKIYRYTFIVTFATLSYNGWKKENRVLILLNLLAPITRAGEYEWASIVRFDRINSHWTVENGEFASFIRGVTFAFRDRVKSPGKLTEPRVARMVLTTAGTGARVPRYKFFRDSLRKQWRKPHVYVKNFTDLPSTSRWDVNARGPSSFSPTRAPFGIFRPHFSAFFSRDRVSHPSSQA